MSVPCAICGCGKFRTVEKHKKYACKKCNTIRDHVEPSKPLSKVEIADGLKTLEETPVVSMEAI